MQKCTVGPRAADQGKRLASLSLTANADFKDGEQGAAFTAALRDAVADAEGRPLPRPGRSDGPLRPFRLFLGCHPIPAPTAGDTDPEPGDPDE